MGQIEIFPRELPRNPTHAEVSAMDIRVVVQDPTWQGLRKDLVGSWMTKARRNVSWLREYLATDPECPYRLRRVHNYLTGSAFRMGKISSPEITQLLSEVRQKRGM